MILSHHIPLSRKNRDHLKTGAAKHSQNKRTISVSAIEPLKLSLVRKIFKVMRFRVNALIMIDSNRLSFNKISNNNFRQGHTRKQFLHAIYLQLWSYLTWFQRKCQQIFECEIWFCSAPVKTETQNRVNFTSLSNNDKNMDIIIIT